MTTLRIFGSDGANESGGSDPNGSRRGQIRNRGKPAPPAKPSRWEKFVRAIPRFSRAVCVAEELEVEGVKTVAERITEAGRQTTRKRTRGVPKVEYVVYSCPEDNAKELGSGWTEAAAWMSAAKKLPRVVR